MFKVRGATQDLSRNSPGTKGSASMRKLALLKVLGSNASVLGDTREHSRTNFLAIVKSEDKVGPSFA